jgi:hypothetical protein
MDAVPARIDCSIEPRHQPRQDRGRHRDGHRKRVARRFAGVVLINDHPNHRHECGDQGRKGAERSRHRADILHPPQSIKVAAWITRSHDAQVQSIASMAIGGQIVHDPVLWPCVPQHESYRRRQLLANVAIAASRCRS